MALNLSQPIVFDRLQSGVKIMDVPRDQAIALVRKYSITNDKYLSDMLYTLVSLGNTGVINFMNFTGPKHVLQPRLNSCAWRAKGRIGIVQSNLNLSPVEINMTQCPDAFYGGPWERIFGVGNNIANLAGTAEGRALIDEMLRVTFEGIGNSTHMLLEHGQNALIDIADDNGYYPVGALEWDDFKDQQQILMGRITLIDELKDDGLDQYNVDIASYINPTTGAWTGDIFDFLNSLIAARTSQFTIAEGQIGGTVKGIIELDEVTFGALKSQLLDRFNNIPAVYQLFIEGISGVLDTSKYLMYEGYGIRKATQWKIFDTITGTRTRRALLSYPKVHGIGFDVPALNEYDGLGLKVEQSPLLRDKGRIDMFGALKLGAVIIDTNFVVNASATLFPPFVV